MKAERERKKDGATWRYLESAFWNSMKSFVRIDPTERRKTGNRHPIPSLSF
jgi:hypothetical protein